MNLRKEIFNVLYQIVNDGGYSNIVIDNYLKTTNLSKLDQKFLVRVVYGVLQNYEYLEWEISKVNTSKTPKIKMRLLLMLSIYQLRFMDKVPDYAIVNEAVEIAREIDYEPGAGYANAMLRKLIKEKPVLNREDFSSNAEYFSILYSHPQFIVEMWLKKFGEEITLKLLELNHQEAPFTVRMNLLATTRERILSKSYFEPLTLSPIGFKYIGSESISETSEFQHGEISIQDEASQIIVPLLQATVNDDILDMCAAPGSKSIQIAESLDNKGNITAVDFHPHRVELINKGAKRLGITSIKTLEFDSRNLTDKFGEKAFNKILLDAPCSGLGVIRRKPDILLRVCPETIDELIILQKELLEEAYRLLKEDGTLVYSTCTLTKKENELQINSFLDRHKDIQLIEQKQILSFENNTDSFYYAVMRKNNE